MKKLEEILEWGILNPVIGALVHNAGSVFVIINSEFLLNIQITISFNKWKKALSLCVLAIGLLWLFYLLAFFPKLRETISSSAPKTIPIIIARIYMIGLVIAPTKTANIPPCGAFDLQSKSILKAPATPLEINSGGMTLKGLLAANGMAPSVMKESPMT